MAGQPYVRVGEFVGPSGQRVDAARETHALEAAPDDPAIAEAVAALYTERGARESSLMATNLHRSAATGALSRFPPS
ncbi:MULTISPECIES: hypothetical protein [unclassified Streptomyces]|uniref:hypothetical protein n=1 Tax=unclassified Streptomyces TaxID=2593676 RepID=UPI001CBCD020|nr:MULTISPECIES: hypothetical protein [unclassified Streptomyces]WPO70850.1 hypothetical protein R9806_09535 [Streptomyces sp. KN37]